MYRLLFLAMLFSWNTITTAQMLGYYKLESMAYFFDYYHLLILSGTENDTLYALSPCFSSYDSSSYVKKMETNNIYEFVLLKVNSENKIKLMDKPRFTHVDGYVIDGTLINIGDTLMVDTFLILNACGEYILPINKELLKHGTLLQETK